MSAIDPKNFRKARDIARAILDFPVDKEDSEMTFAALAELCTNPEAAREVNTQEVKELLDNLRAIANARATVLAMGAKNARTLLQDMKAHCTSVGECMRSSVHPELKPDDPISQLVHFLRMAGTGTAQIPPEINEHHDADSTQMYYTWKRYGKSIDCILPLIDELADALERERGKGPEAGR